MDIRFVTSGRVEHGDLAALGTLLERDDGFVWIDLGAWEPDAVAVLSGVFGFHPLAVQECVERNRVAKAHAYHDHLFCVVHGPELGTGGHVHYVELDQFIGHRYLVTVHGPVNPAVDPEVAFTDTRAVARRMETGRLSPTTPMEVSHAIVSSLARGMEAFVEELTGAVWRLEQRVTAGPFGEPEHFLDEMFRTRHGLLASSTIAAGNRRAHERMLVLGRLMTPEARPFVEGLVEQFDHVANLANTQRDYLQGVIDSYRTRVDTKNAIAAERLAVIAAVTLPVTAVASVYGMNIIVNNSTSVGHVAGVVAVMVAMSTLLLLWARRRGWW